MKIEIFGSPRFHLELTLRDVEFCISRSQLHYDATCRAAGKDVAEVEGRTHPAGFLCIWQHQLEFAARERPDEPLPRVQGTWRQLDTLLKILEIRAGCSDAELALLRNLRLGLTGALSMARDCLEQWRAEFVLAQPQLATEQSSRTP
jgi:hypothetical protein